MKKSDDIPIGTIRIKAKGTEAIKKTKNGWSKTDFNTHNIKQIAHLFKAHANFNALLDPKDKTFLKGYLSPEKRIGGEKISIMPNGEKLNKAYSLFSPHLMIHDEENDTHWDIIFQNPNGEYSYLYTFKKQKESAIKKYKKVKDFKNHLPTLEKNLKKALEKGELMALPLYTLLKTKMRVGNKYSYSNSGHQGLTTLQKQNVNVLRNTATFNYIGKDGVPQEQTEKFPDIYLTKLTDNLASKKKNDFIFTDKLGNPLKDTHFETAFKDYCGQRFYPHIVRSYYATTTVEDFIKKNKKPNKEQIEKLYTKIADKLGHKKFVKKDNEWETSYTVTIAHYIQPELIEKINKMIS